MVQNGAMPNIASVLKSEIARVARKEVRAEVEALKKSASQHRSALAAVRRQVEVLQRELKRLTKDQGNRRDPGRSASAEPKSDVSPRRFSATRLAAHRNKLQISASSYGKLLGLSGQTIYNWEQGKSRPSAAQIQQLALLKEQGKSELMRLLDTATPQS